MNGSSKSLKFNHMNISGDVSLEILGSGNSLVGEGNTKSNVYLGDAKNSNSSLKILGSGNSFSDKSGWSFMMGNVESVSGQNLLRVHSSSTQVSGKNSFTIPSSVNSFIYLSTAENSDARNTVSIGDNSSVDFQTNLFLGANSSSNAIKSGVAEIVLDGKGSTLSFGSLYVGSNKAKQDGGSAQIIMGGELNTVSVTSNIRIGASSGKYEVNNSQSGGKNGIYITGKENGFTTTATISIASDWDMSGGVNEFVVSGTSNFVNFNTAQVGYGNASNKFSGGTNRFLVSGTSNVITASQGINVQSDNQTGGESIFEVAGSKNEIYFSGNNQVGRAMSGGKDAWILGGENNKAEYKYAMSFLIGRTAAMTGGEASLEIRGKNNTFKTYNLFIGNEGTTNGKAKFIVEGSGHTINVMNSLQAYFSGNEDASGKKMGGGFQFIADSDGFSTINVNSFDTTFTGLIEIDFSKYIVKDEIEGDEFTLISITNKANNLLTEDLQSNPNKYFSVSGSDKYEIVFGSKTLGVKVFSTSIPEPSTYAAIFGALAIAFALYRRRK